MARISGEIVSVDKFRSAGRIIVSEKLKFTMIGKTPNGEGPVSIELSKGPFFHILEALGIKPHEGITGSASVPYQEYNFVASKLKGRKVEITVV